MGKIFLVALVWIQCLSLGLWIGSLAAVPFFASATFQGLEPDRLAAGEIVGEALKRMGRMHLACGTALALSSAALAFLCHKAAPNFFWKFLGIIRIILPFSMLLATLVLLFGVAPRMETLRAQIPRDNPSQWQGEGKQEFDKLHQLYVRLSQGVLVGGSVLFLILAVEGVRKWSDSENSSGPSRAPSA